MRAKEKEREICNNLIIRDGKTKQFSYRFPLKAIISQKIRLRLVSSFENISRRAAFDKAEREAKSLINGNDIDPQAKANLRNVLLNAWTWTDSEWWKCLPLDRNDERSAKLKAERKRTCDYRARNRQFFRPLLIYRSREPMKNSNYLQYVKRKYTKSILSLVPLRLWLFKLFFKLPTLSSARHNFPRNFSTFQMELIETTLNGTRDLLTSRSPRT